MYITNNNLLITKTTFLPDLGFDLSFAKDIFEKHEKENLLSFHSIGEVIQDRKAIFKKYIRENTVVGGYGLGLSIVHEITKITKKVD